MSQKEHRIAELKAAMQYEVDNNFPNGDRWNELSDELDELEREPTVFEFVSAILRSTPNHDSWVD
jgi:hypothetical protein